MKVSIVIPNYNGERYLEECLVSLKAQTFTEFETILVDNASNDRSIIVAREIIPDIICIELKTNTGFSAAVNCGIRKSIGEYVVLLNNDTLLNALWLEELVSCIENHPKAFSCASKMIQYHQRDLIDNVGDTMTLFGWAYQEGMGDKQICTTIIELFLQLVRVLLYTARKYLRKSDILTSFFRILRRCRYWL